MDGSLGSCEKTGCWGAEVEARGNYDLTNRKNDYRRESIKPTVAKKDQAKEKSVNKESGIDPLMKDSKSPQKKGLIQGRMGGVYGTIDDRQSCIDSTMAKNPCFRTVANDELEIPPGDQNFTTVGSPCMKKLDTEGFPSQLMHSGNSFHTGVPALTSRVSSNYSQRNKKYATQGNSNGKNFANTTPIKKTKQRSTASPDRGTDNPDLPYENLNLDNYLSYTKAVDEKNLTRNNSYENFIDYTILHGIIGVSNDVSELDKEKIIYEFERRKEMLGSEGQRQFKFYGKKPSHAGPYNNPKTKILINTQEDVDLH